MKNLTTAFFVINIIIDAVLVGYVIIKLVKYAKKRMPSDLNLKNIESDGWVRSFRYPMRGSNNEWGYDKESNGIRNTITVDFDDDGSIKQVFTHSGCQQRTIKSIKDLKYFFENNK